MSEEYKLIFDSRDDLEHVKAHCTCGELEFEGDWDELCSLWFRHAQNLEYEYLYIEKDDHKSLSLLTREAGKRLRELWPDKFGDEDE